MDLLIKNRKLVPRLSNITQKDWVKLAEREGFLVVYGNSGSHYISVRDPQFPDTQDIRGLITVLTPNCFKQANIQIFKKFVVRGHMPEDNVWKGLGLL